MSGVVHGAAIILSQQIDHILTSSALLNKSKYTWIEFVGSEITSNSGIKHAKGNGNALTCKGVAGLVSSLGQSLDDFSTVEAKLVR